MSKKVNLIIDTTLCLLWIMMLTILNKKETFMRVVSVVMITVSAAGIVNHFDKRKK